MKVPRASLKNMRDRQTNIFTMQVLKAVGELCCWTDLDMIDMSCWYDRGDCNEMPRLCRASFILTRDLG